MRSAAFTPLHTRASFASIQAATPPHTMAHRRSGQIWSVTFGTDIDGANDYLVTNGSGSSYAPSGDWDEEGQSDADYASTSGNDKRVHIQGDTGLSWSDNFEFEIVFVLPQDDANNSNWPVFAKLSGGSLRFGAYVDLDGLFQVLYG